MTYKRLFPALFSPPIGSNLRGDFAGAVSATLVGVPQSLAYGLIAVSTLGPEWVGIGALAGLFSSVVAGLLMAALGSNPVNVMGPRAGTLLVFAALVGRFLQLQGVDTTGAIAYGCLAVAGASVAQCLFGLSRLGRVADFIPYPVIAGIMNSSGLLIILSQIRPMLGLPKGAISLHMLAEWPLIQPGTVALAMATLLAILVAPRVIKGVPPLLVGVLAGTGLYHAAGLLGMAGLLGGTVPPLPEHLTIGLTRFADLVSAVQNLPAAAAMLMLTSTLSMAALATLDTVCTSLTIDELTSRRTNTDRELVAQGATNAVAVVFGLLPCAGSLARTAPLVRSGGRTALAPIMTALMMALVAVAFAPLVQLLPRAAMAAVLTVTGVGILDKWSLGILGRLRWRTLAQLPHADLLAMATVVASSLVYNLVTAVGVGTMVSLIFFVLRMARSPVRRSYRATALALRVHGDAERSTFIQRHGEAIAIVEVDGVLFFGSIAALQKQVEALIEQGVRHIVLDLKRVKDLDVTAARAIERLHVALASRGGRLVLAYLHPERRHYRVRRRALPGERRQGSQDRQLWRVLARVGTLRVLDTRQLAADLDKAVAICESDLALRLGTDARALAFSLPQSTILRGIDRDALRRLRPYLARRRYMAGDQVFRQGDPPDSIYFLAAGRVDVMINLPRTDRQLRVQTLARGAIFGEMAIIDPQPRSANITAVESSICYRLSAEEFERLKQCEAQIAFRLLENTGLIFVERLRASNLMIAELEA